eukprot:5635568-Amphidinium_carterae.1
MSKSKTPPFGTPLSTLPSRKGGVIVLLLRFVPAQRSARAAPPAQGHDCVRTRAWHQLPNEDAW